MIFQRLNTYNHFINTLILINSKFTNFIFKNFLIKEQD